MYKVAIGVNWLKEGEIIDENNPLAESGLIMCESEFDTLVRFGIIEKCGVWSDSDMKAYGEFITRGGARLIGFSPEEKFARFQRFRS